MIKIINQRALFRIQERCAKHARILSGWSSMVSLSKRPETIFIALYFGGIKQQKIGNTTKYYIG
jgi:hypothetical protein